jgi:molybdopterin-guanine dinucleotide biosynthesis protein A
MVAGAILAGGGATRFGGAPKGLALLDGERIADRLARLLHGTLGAPPVLIANAPDAATWQLGLRIERDVRPGAGALGGILSALVHAPAPVVVLAWDMPYVTAALVRRLAEGLERAAVVIPASDGRRGLEPLCAAYGPACRAPIEAAIARGDLRAIAFHQDVTVDVVPLEEVAEYGDPARLFFNVNTTADLDAAGGAWPG